MHQIDIQNINAQDLELITRFLPHSLKPVEQLIGLKKTLCLVREFGGQVFVIPKSEHGPGAARFAEIAEVIGVRETLLLGQYFGADDFYVPRCAQLSLALRDRNLTQEFDELLKSMGALRAANHLARRHGMTARQVEMIVNGKGGARSPYQRSGAKARGSAPATSPKKYDTASLNDAWR